MQSIKSFEVSFVNNGYNRYILNINKYKKSFCRFCGEHEETQKGQGLSDLPNYFQRFQKALRFALRCRLTCYDCLVPRRLSLT